MKLFAKLGNVLFFVGFLLVSFSCGKSSSGMDEGGENKIEEGESDYVFVEDIGDSDWDAAVLGKEGLNYFYKFKDGISEEFAIWDNAKKEVAAYVEFDENGYPKNIIAGEYTYVFGNVSENVFDLAVMQAGELVFWQDDIPVVMNEVNIDTRAFRGNTKAMSSLMDSARKTNAMLAVFSCGASIPGTLVSGGWLIPLTVMSCSSAIVSVFDVACNGCTPGWLTEAAMIAGFAGSLGSSPAALAGMFCATLSNAITIIAIDREIEIRKAENLLTMEISTKLQKTGFTTARIELPVKHQISFDKIWDTHIEGGIFYGKNPSLPANDRIKEKDEHLNSVVLANGGTTGVVELKNLKPNTTYYYKPYLVYGMVISEGEIKEFKTGEIQTLGSYLSGENAVFEGKFTSTEVPTLYGICYADNPSLTNCVDLTSTNANAEGKFSISSTLPNNDDLYYYRSYVKEGEQYYYGDIKRFNSPVGTWKCYKCVVMEKKCEDFPEIYVGKTWESEEGGTIIFNSDNTGRWLLDEEQTSFVWRFDIEEQVIYATIQEQPEMPATVLYANGEFCMAVNDKACGDHVTDVYWRYYKRIE
ncbi:hypothetical protein [Bacteroides finegoldii]|uniref:hypothetical protein n=1 Tax=Bacteroides finegoldii TaxID=338188 RepID=UPI00189A8A6A|nr:hypothetical protein [Bacteroides finegoldii]